MTRVSLLTLIGLLLHICSVSAQDFHLLETSGEGATISSKAYAFDTDGNPISIPANELSATVNGASAQIAEATGQPGNSRGVSVVVCIDASESMSAGNNTGLASGAAAAKALVSLLGPNDEISLIQFSDRPTILHGLTTDKAAFEQAVDNLRPGFGSNIEAALTDQTMGGLTHSRSAANQRVVIYITDASNRFDNTLASNLAQSFRTQVYSINVDSPVSQDLSVLTANSGGASLSIQEAELTDAARSCIAHAKQLRYTQIEVTPPTPCLTDRTLTITRGSVNRTVDNVSDQTEGVSFLEWSTPGLEFASEGQPGNQRVRLTARGAAITVNGVSITSAEFSIENGISPGTVINEDEFIELNVQYAGSPRGVFGEIQLNATGCPAPSLYCRGGSLTSGKVLEATAPSGGEEFLAGTSATITWTNILPQDHVGIDFSTDGGSSWQPLTESASGNSWEWVTGPLTTTGGKIRVRRTVINEEDIAVMNGHIGPVYGTDVLRGDYGVVTGGQDGTVRLWNIDDGSYTKQLGTHTGWVWSVAAHPTELVVASGSHDGSVRVWDVESGVRLGTFLADSRVWTVEFSPDGSMMAVGTENSLTLVSYPALDVVRTVNPGGSRVQASTFSPDGTLLLSGEGATATIRRVDNLSIATEYSVHANSVYAAAFSPDGLTAYTGGADNEVHAWNASNGTTSARSYTMLGSVLDIDVSSDGASVLSSGTDGTAAIWRASDLSKLNTLAGHAGPVQAVAFSASATTVVTTSSDETGRVWNVSDAIVIEDQSSSTFSVIGGTSETSDNNFGSVVTLSGKESETTLLENTGTTDIVVLSGRIVEGDVADFIVDEGMFPATLSAGEKLTMNATFLPRTEGTKTASVEFELGTGVSRATLNGNGVLPTLAYSQFKPEPASQVLDFGRVIGGQSIRDSLISLRLVQTDPILIASTTIRGVQSDAFTITEGSGSVTITPTVPRNIRIQFAPPSIGNFAAELVLTAEDGTEFVVRLYGEGTGNAALFSSSNTLLYQTEQCEFTSRIETVPLTNTGGSDLQIHSISITGADSDEFTIENPPTVIKPSESYDLNVRFTPTRIGVKEATLVVTSNGIGSNNGTLQVPIVARQDNTGFELSVTSIEFSNVNEGETAEQQVNLINTGSTSILWETAPIILGDFTIVSIEPEITPPGSQSAVTIRFNGGVVNQEYSESYTFVDSVCNLGSTLSMTATVKSYIGCTIDIDSIGATIGSTTSVPVRITNRVNFDRTAITTIGARLSVNGTILTPSGSDKGTFLPTGTRTFDVLIPIPTDGEVATVLQFETTWGNDTGSVIRIDSVWVDDTVVVRNDPGYVQLTDLCRQGGARLFLVRDERGEGLRTRVIPHPVTTTSTIDFNVVENGPTTMQLVDLTGRVLQTIVNRDLQRGRYLLPLDTEELEAGTYVLVVQTRTQRLSNRISVVR